MKTKSILESCRSGQPRFRASGLFAAAVFAGVLLAQIAGAQTYSLSPAWSLATTANQRAGAYSSISNQLILPNTGGSIAVYDGTTGTSVGSMSFAAVTTSGTQIINQLGVADDGVIYGANLTTAVSGASVYRIYRWPSWNGAGSNAYTGDPTLLSTVDGKRLGDSFAITGSGVNTRILTGIATTNCFVLFSTTDGTNFTPTIITNITGLPNFSTGGLPLAFYTNNTFMIKPVNTSPTNFLVQYPANFAGNAGVSGTVLTNFALTLPTSPSANGQAIFSYNRSTAFLGVTFTGSSGTAGQNYYSRIYSLSPTNFGAGATLLTSTNYTAASNANLTGGVAFGGAGNTNFFYSFNSANILQAFAVNFTALPVAPTIATAPAGVTGAFPTYTLSVSANGSTPLKYQWLCSNAGTNISSTFTNIPGANTNTYAITTASTNYYEVTITNSAGAVTSAPVRVALLTPVTSTVITQLWRIAPGATGYAYLTTGDDNRGLAYDTNSQRVVVASRSPGLYILDGNTGANLGSLDLSGVIGGTFPVDQVGIADDGAVYACNLSISGQTVKLYRWGAPTNTAPNAIAFQDTSSTLGTFDRWGDTMAIRGSGANTQIILGSRSGTNFALLTTADGISFSGQVIAVSNAPAGFAGLGITFGAGNTLYAKNYISHLYQVSFDPVNNVGGVVLDYPNPAQTPTYLTAIGVDPVNNILAGIDMGDVPHDLKFYQLTGTSDAPVLFHQAFFPTYQANGNYVGAVAMKYPRVYAIDANNGIVAATYGVPPTTPPAVITPPASQSSYTNNPALTFSASVSGSLPLYYQWQFSTASNGPFANLGAATASTYTLNYPQPAAAGYYRMIVHNVGGYATSAPPALLTVLLPTTSMVVTQIWTVPAGGSLGFLDTTSYQTRGLAFDTNTLQLIVADHNSLHVLNATNGTYLGDLNVAGVPTGGYAGWNFDQIGFSDDGYLFAGNLAGVSGSGTYSVTGWAPPISVGEPPSIPSYANSDPGSGSGDRWGDTMAIRGSVSDASLQILLGSWSGTNVVLFTSDTSGILTPNLIAVAGVPAGFSGQGIAFGAGNTFWSKSPGYDLRLVAFNTNSTPGTGSVIYDFTSGTQVPGAFAGISVDPGAGILGGVNFTDKPNDFQLYLLSGNSNPPALVNQAFFGSGNLNVNQNSVSTLKAGYGFALDVNNGITALTYGTPAAPAVTITSIGYAPGSVTINWNNTFAGHGYQVQTTTNLLAGWTNLGSPVTTASPTAAYTDSTASVSARFYRVISQ
jgi:hypothetical protein